jgi:alpha-galactosidase
MPIFDGQNSWVLETAHTGYAIGLNHAGRLTHRYWGARLPFADDYPAAPNPTNWASFSDADHLTPEEFPAYAGAKYIDPCLKVTFPDGVRDCVLVFDSAVVSGAQLTINLRDAHYPLQISLHYHVHASADLIERSVSITHTGSTDDGIVTLERVLSAAWHVPPHAPTENYRLTHLNGRWLDEFHIQREVLTPGIKVLESRRLTTSHHANPWVALDRGQADEDQGDVWFTALAWSGNWRITAEVTDFAQTRLLAGLNDWDFAWKLAPGETFTTPSSFGGFTPHGFGEASRTLHRFIRDQVVPHKHALRQVLYNSWEATTFDVAVGSQTKLAEIAALMGVELFVMDDGWFHGRDHDQSGLGDWWPDERKFPDGLAPLIERVNALGMDFGLWLEPEMVNPDSDLYRAHPDWVIHFPTRARSEMRNQLILNVARTDVQDALIARIDGLLSNHNITFIKWDMNRNVSEPGWPNAPGDQRELWVRYVEGLYRVWGALRERHPNVTWQSCSGGGGRADMGMLRLADQIWVSDNTEATARLSIQNGFSLAYPASTMEAWVTDAEHNRVPLAFRFHASMCGVLGIGGNLPKWTNKERAEAAHWIGLYKEIRPVVQFGSQYRLRPAQDSAYSAVMYVSEDQAEAVLFAFRIYIPDPTTLPPIYLRGLQPDAQYVVEGFSGARSGMAWMQAGLTIPLTNLESTVRRIQRV